MWLINMLNENIMCNRPPHNIQHKMINFKRLIINPNKAQFLHFISLEILTYEFE